MVEGCRNMSAPQHRLACRGQAGSEPGRDERLASSSRGRQGGPGMATSSRRVEKIVVPEPVVEGAGVHLKRSIATRRLDSLDPFLLLDHFESTDPALYEPGFPYHPHRGMETVTLVRAGEVRHGDSLGHAGAIGAGDIQWMSAGSGIMHEEMPQVRPEGIAGLQIWLNLPARDKMSRPKYRDLRADRLVMTETAQGATIRVIAGEADGGRVIGPV